MNTGSMKRTSLLTLYRHNMKNGIAQAMQFRADFAVGVFSSLLYSLLSVIIQFLVYRLTNGFPGWPIEQMIVFQGMFILWTGMRETLFGGVRELMVEIMWRGELDQMLLKPFHSGAYLLASGFDFSKIGSIAAGAAVIVIGFPATGATLTVWGLAVFTACLAAGLLLYMAFLLFFCALTIVIINSNRFIELMERLFNFAEYPSEIYPRVARLAFDVGVPFAVFIGFPARALLGRLDWVMAGAAGMSVVIFAAGLLVWRLVIRRYTSAGG
jgi:ABC-2 type transport system permease protein